MALLHNCTKKIDHKIKIHYQVALARATRTAPTGVMATATAGVMVAVGALRTVGVMSSRGNSSRGNDSRGDSGDGDRCLYALLEVTAAARAMVAAGASEVADAGMAVLHSNV